MPYTKEITTYDNNVSIVSLEEADNIEAAMARKEKQIKLRDGTILAIADIRRVEKRTVRYDPPAMELMLPSTVDLDAIEPRNELQGRWLKLIKLNLLAIRQKKKPTDLVPLLKDLCDLEAYETAGKWPEYEPPAKYRTFTPATSHRAWWVKRRMTLREFNSQYAAAPIYYKLELDGSDVWVGSLTTSQTRIGPGLLELCNPNEVKRLEYLRSRRFVG